MLFFLSIGYILLLFTCKIIWSEFLWSYWLLFQASHVAKFTMGGIYWLTGPHAKNSFENILLKLRSKDENWVPNFQNKDRLNYIQKCVIECRDWNRNHHRRYRKLCPVEMILAEDTNRKEHDINTLRLKQFAMYLLIFRGIYLLVGVLLKLSAAHVSLRKRRPEGRKTIILSNHKKALIKKQKEIFS